MLKDILKIGQKKFLFINDLNGREIARALYKKEPQKTNQKQLRTEKVIKSKGNKLYVKWKGYYNSLIAGLIKNTLCKNASILSLKQFKSFAGNINVKVDLSNYAAKTDLKNATVTDTSKLAAKAHLASLKSEVDKLDIDKWVPVSVHLSKLSDIVKNNVIKKTVYDKLIAKVNNIDTKGLALKTKYESELVRKTPDTSGLVKKNRL